MGYSYKAFIFTAPVMLHTCYFEAFSAASHHAGLIPAFCACRSGSHDL